jgi:primosomal protein N' (replication factor Y)
VALLKPLKLRSEKVAKKLEPSANQPVVHVLVDTGVYHLDEKFSYIVPADMDADCQPGVLVKIPFGRGIKQGVVLERAEASVAGLKFLERNLSNVPLVTSAQLSFFSKVAQRYGCKIWDVLHLAIPTITKSAEMFHLFPDANRSAVPTKHFAYEIPSGVNIAASLALTIQEHLKMGAGKVVVIFPDEKSLSRATQVLDADVVLSSNLKPSERYTAYLRANSLRSGVVFGLRSAIFLDCAAEDLLVIVNDVDENHYERRFPRYNSRDVALLRAQNTNLLFLFHSASLEIARLMEMGWLRKLELGSSTSSVERFVVQCEEGESSKVHGLISEGLKRGSVLVVHANTGYVNSFLCAHCRNIALCECGGRLTLKSNNSQVSCSICMKFSSDWRCRHCQRSVKKSIGVGVEKRAEDYGRSFPRTLIVHSTSQSPHIGTVSKGTLAICTPGMEPAGVYDTILLMDGERLFSRTELRADELSLLRWREAASLLSPNGVLYISLPPQHFVAQAFLRGSFIQTYRNMIAERTSAHLPPNFRVATLETEEEVAVNLKEALLREFNRDELSIVSSRNKAKQRLLLQIALTSGDAVMFKLHEINRVRSLRGERVLPISIDAFDLTPTME